MNVVASFMPNAKAVKLGGLGKRSLDNSAVEPDTASLLRAASDNQRLGSGLPQWGADLVVEVAGAVARDGLGAGARPMAAVSGTATAS